MIAIITINYNLSKETIPCIESILVSEFTDFKIYLIDNGSRHEDYQLLADTFSENLRLQLFRIDKNCGYVGGVNYGIKRASVENPDYYLIMNNDTIIDRYAIGYLVETSRIHNNRAIVSGKVYYYDQPDVLQHTGVIFKDSRYLITFYPCKNQKDTGQCDEEAERDSLDDVFWLLPAQLVKDVGYYCDYFFLYAEQGDYAQRARRKGYKLMYTPKAKIWHKESMTTGAGNARALPIYYYRGQGRFVFQYRNLQTKYFILITLKNLANIISRIIFKKGYDRKCALALFRGYLWGFRWMINKKPNSGVNPYIKKG